MPERDHQPSKGAAPDIEAWRRLVARARAGGDLAALTSRTRDDIPIEPLYARRREPSGVPAPAGGPWTIVQLVDDPDPDRANAQALTDLEGGATGLSLRFANAPSGQGLPPGPTTLAIALEGLDLATLHLRLEPHRDVLRSAVALKVQIDKSGIAPERTDVVFGLDPLPRLVDRSGALDPSEFAGIFAFLRDEKLRGPLVLLDARPYHEAGASEAQELAGALAAAVWWLRTLDECETASPAEAMPFFGASLSTDRDLYLSIAKLRALRLLWARLQDLVGAPRTPISVHAETSRRMLTRADPDGNLLRTTLAAFAAVVGGADAITVVPHRSALGPADSNARALARNIQHLLMDEAHLDRVADPAAGSGAIEALTDALAAQAWAEFQLIESEGGIAGSLGTGKLQARIEKARDMLARDVASGARPLVGVTAYRAEDAASSSRGREGHVAASLCPISLEALAEEAA